MTVADSSHFTYDAMEDVLQDVGLALRVADDQYVVVTPVDAPFNQNGIPALRVRDAKGRSFVITALPEAD